MKVYNVALIGCGHMGNININYVCDKDIDKAMEFSRLFGAKHISTNVEECISSSETDIVIIATYPSTHLSLLKLCIQYKKHVICEKPIATTLEDGQEFVKLVRENPEVKVLVGHILRHNATYRKVAKMIHDGAIGQPIIMRMTQNHHTMDWDRYRALLEEASPVIDCGVHYLDVMRWFTGAEVVDISGIGMRTEEDLPQDKYNYEMITVRLSDGSVGFYEAGWAKTIASSNLKEFVGPKGAIRLVYEKDRMEHQEEGDLIEYYNQEEQSYQIINMKAERKQTDVQMNALIRMIEEGLPARPTIDDIYASFEASIQAEAVIQRAMQKRNL